MFAVYGVDAATVDAATPIVVAATAAATASGLDANPAATPHGAAGLLCRAVAHGAAGSCCRATGQTSTLAEGAYWIL
jgi:hypothetical protein